MRSLGVHVASSSRSSKDPGLCAELEDCGGNLPDGTQHALKRPHLRLWRRTAVSKKLRIEICVACGARFESLQGSGRRLEIPGKA